LRGCSAALEFLQCYGHAARVGVLPTLNHVAMNAPTDGAD
jgi:hypothetical protein